MAVYHKDNPEHFAVALDSMLYQTYPADEIVIVKDGPITKALQEVIDERSSRDISFHELALETNRGHGEARRVGVEACRNELIAVMDADDISVPTRCEQQVTYMEKNCETDVLGGQIEEFIGNPNDVVGKRLVPLTDKEIKTYLRVRCPMNQVTVMFRKSSVVRVGNYQDWYSNEDYYLWIRQVLAGGRFANLPSTLVFVRVGQGMYHRRGGWKYFKSEYGIQKLMLDKGIINRVQFGMNVMARLVLQVLMPNWLRGIVFQKMARQ